MRKTKTSIVGTGRTEQGNRGRGFTLVRTISSCISRRHEECTCSEQSKKGAVGDVEFYDDFRCEMCFVCCRLSVCWFVC